MFLVTAKRTGRGAPKLADLFIASSELFDVAGLAGLAALESISVRVFLLTVRYLHSESRSLLGNNIP